MVKAALLIAPFKELTAELTEALTQASRTQIRAELRLRAV
jgi:hypothetical protein